jgi:hypothetical protein
MSTIVSVVGIVIAGFGILGVIRPETLMRLVSLSWQAPSGLYLAMAVRVIFGVALIGAASSSRFPNALLIIGVLSIITAAVALLLGFERLRAFVDWWLARPPGLIRTWAAIASAFGVFLVCAVW